MGVARPVAFVAGARSVGAGVNAGLLRMGVCAPSTLLSRAFSMASEPPRNAALVFRFLGETQEREDSRLLSLDNLRDIKGSRQKPKRVGRGRGNGLGKTCGRGHKGAGQRKKNKNPYRGFEGGQTPLWKRTPKRGSRLHHLKTKHFELNLAKLLQWLQMGRLDPSKKIDMKAMYDSGLLSGFRPLHIDGVKILSKGGDRFLEQYPKMNLPPLDIECSHASETAEKILQQAGCTFKRVFMTNQFLRFHVQPHKKKEIDAYNTLGEGFTGYPPVKKFHLYPEQAAMATREARNKFCLDYEQRDAPDWSQYEYGNKKKKQEQTEA